MSLAKSQDKVILPFIIFIIAVFTKIIPSFSEYLTADACIYLDIGRNIFSKKGFSLSYNLYQFWAGQVYYPALPLFPPLYPLLVGIIWKLFHSIQATIMLNVFIAAINSVFFYYILNAIYKNIHLSFLATLLFSICMPMQQTAMFPWSEQLSLLCLLVASFIFIKNFCLDISLMIKIGIIFGIGFLIRADIVFNLLAFIFFILLNYKLNKQSIIACLCLLGGFLMIILPYELFCIWKYRLFYPAYLKVNSVGFMKALTLGGYYDVAQKPVLRANILPWQETFISLIIRIPHTTKLFLREILKNLNFLLVFLILRTLIIFKNNYSKEKFLFIIGVSAFFTHTLFLCYQPAFNYIDIIRFSLIHFSFLIPLSIAGFYYFYDYLRKVLFKKTYLILYFVAIFIISIFPEGLFSFAINMNKTYFTNRFNIVIEKNELRKRFSEWLKNRTLQDELIAASTNLMQEAFILERPVISLPTGKFLNPKHMRQFLDIYKPSFIAIDMHSVDKYRNLISSFANELGGGEDWQSLYHVYKIDYSKIVPN